MKTEPKKAIVTDDTIPEELQKTLNRIAPKVGDRKDELVEILSNEQPAKSGMVDSHYVHCTWWEGCYYCQDENNEWHRVKCFM